MLATEMLYYSALLASRKHYACGNSNTSPGIAAVPPSLPPLPPRPTLNWWALLAIATGVMLAICLIIKVLQLMLATEVLL